MAYLNNSTPIKIVKPDNQLYLVKKARQGKEGRPCFIEKRKEGRPCFIAFLLVSREVKKAR
jgi:hypothetical protein